MRTYGSRERSFSFLSLSFDCWLFCLVQRPRSHTAFAWQRRKSVTGRCHGNWRGNPSYHSPSHPFQEMHRKSRRMQQQKMIFVFKSASLVDRACGRSVVLQGIRSVPGSRSLCSHDAFVGTLTASLTALKPVFPCHAQEKLQPYRNPSKSQAGQPIQTERFKPDLPLVRMTVVSLAL